MVNMPWAMTPGSPTPVAKASFQWMGLKSPEAPAYLTRSVRVTLDAAAADVLADA